MKMKIGELKAHLSRVVRQLQRGETPAVEVCVREEPVAYLTAIRSSDVPAPTVADRERLLAQRFSRVGLILHPPAAPAALPACPQPQRAGDGDTTRATVPAMRAEKAW